ncbi:MAG: type II toxin-antitoxin system Phd/YefM family antitoxin [Syntrophomonadaceae bacterium]|nr:type II toxin-antitoxin system Phd/YefM family antitoxin [Syntrophomonadaceae bacterium]
MNIKPSAAIRKNYNEISDLCKRTGAPVFLTKNGEGDLVVMDLDTFARRESMLRLRENLIAAEEGRLYGKPGYSVDEVATMMQAAIREVVSGQQK